MTPQAGQAGQTPAALPRKAYKVGEVAEMLNLGVSTVYELVACKKIKATRIGKAIRISLNSIDAFLSANTEEAD